jgi:F-box/leucine-rich repeat protein 5
MFTDSSKSLQPEFISYCNVIQDGPYPELANGCDNQDCDQLRSCCRNPKI